MTRSWVDELAQHQNPKPMPPYSNPPPHNLHSLARTPQVFTCVSLIFKHLARHMTPQLPSVLRASRGLLYARAPHVRTFAAQAAGFLLRTAAAAGEAAAASDAAPASEGSAGQAGEGDADGLDAEAGAAVRSPLVSAVRQLLRDHAINPTEEVTDGVGLALGESVLGVSHGLHSRAPAILALLLSLDVLQPKDVAPSKAQGSSGDAGIAAGGLSREVLRARATAVACVALDRVHKHLRRGKGGDMWVALHAEAAARMHTLEAALVGAGAATAATPAPTTKTQAAKKAKTAAATSPASEDVDAAKNGEVAVAAASVARITALVAQSVHYFRGSRVEDYGGIQVLLVRLLKAAPAWSHTSTTVSATTAAPAASTPAGDAEAAATEAEAGAEQAVSAGGRKRKQPHGAEAREGSEEEDNEPFLRPSLCGQTLRLVGVGPCWAPGWCACCSSCEGTRACVLLALPGGVSPA